MSGGAGLYEQIALWSQVFGSVAFIVVLVYLFRRFVAPAVLAAQERKNAELVAAEHRRDAAKEDVEKAKRELEVARNAVLGIRSRAAEDATRERERLIAQAKAEGEQLVRNAEGELERARAAARVAFRDDLLREALRIARESGATRIDEAKDRELVGGVLAAVAPEEARSA
ncbi:MAG TPA: ATP synthase F0 subunit B [Candidatus Acidoferrales bacterium]|nr:ATP synthase F0 subunit B [Candidatus Acidoferrales bacterium]